VHGGRTGKREVAKRSVREKDILGNIFTQAGPCREIKERGEKDHFRRLAGQTEVGLRGGQPVVVPPRGKVGRAQTKKLGGSLGRGM